MDVNVNKFAIFSLVIALVVGWFALTNNNHDTYVDSGRVGNSLHSQTQPSYSGSGSYNPFEGATWEDRSDWTEDDWQQYRDSKE